MDGCTVEAQCFVVDDVVAAAAAAAVVVVVVVVVLAGVAVHCTYRYRLICWANPHNTFCGVEGGPPC